MSKEETGTNPTKTTKDKNNTAQPTDPNNDITITNKMTDDDHTLIDNDEEMQDTARVALEKRLTKSVVLRMYEMATIFTLPKVQLTGLKQIPNTFPIMYLATIIDDCHKMPVKIDVEYTEDIYYGRIANNDIIEISGYEKDVLGDKKVIKVLKLKKIGTLPPFPQVDSVKLKYASYGMHKQTNNNPYNNNNNNNNNNSNNNNQQTGQYPINPALLTGIASSYNNLVNPMQSAQSVHARLNQHNAALGVSGYKPTKTFNNVQSLLPNNYIPAKTTTTSGIHIQSSGVSEAAKAQQQEIWDQIKAQNNTDDSKMQSNSNSNSNDNSNNNDNSKDKPNAGPVFDDKEYQKEIFDMLRSEGVSTETHNGAPGNRQLPLQKGHNDTIIPGIQAFGNLSQDQAKYLYDMIHSQSLQVPAQPQSVNDDFNIHTFIKNQKNPQVQAMS